MEDMVITLASTQLKNQDERLLSKAAVNETLDHMAKVVGLDDRDWTDENSKAAVERVARQGDVRLKERYPSLSRIIRRSLDENHLHEYERFGWVVRVSVSTVGANEAEYLLEARSDIQEPT